MTCSEIEKQLPAYREGCLSPDRQTGIARHLDSCPQCSRALADLEAAQKLLGELEAVNPPPFFEQRIMSRVREEAGRQKGLLRKLFYPLHLKIPIQALATVVVAVLAYHVYQQSDPELKRMAPLPAPLTEQGAARVAGRSPQVQLPPPMVGPSRASQADAPAQTVPEAAPVASESKAVPGPPVSRPSTAPQPPAGTPLQQDSRPQGTAISGTRGPAAIPDGPRAPDRQDMPATPATAVPPPAVQEKDALPSRTASPGKLQDRTGHWDSESASGTFSPEPKREQAAVAAATGEARQTRAAVAPARMKASAPPRSALELTLQAGDPSAAIRGIESSLAKVEARIVEHQRRGDAEFWKVELAAQNLPRLLELLEGVGKVSPKTEAAAAPAGTVTVGITLVGLP